MKQNSLFVIVPYRYAGTWVFDDPSVSLVREPFVAGVPAILDKLVKGIPNAVHGFRLTFAGIPFPGHKAKLKWVRFENGGNVYSWVGLEGWLCPALLRYFDIPPQFIYVGVAALGK